MWHSYGTQAVLLPRVRRGMIVVLLMLLSPKFLNIGLPSGHVCIVDCCLVSLDMRNLQRMGRERWTDNVFANGGTNEEEGCQVDCLAEERDLGDNGLVKGPGWDGVGVFRAVGGGGE